jgi:hypothetical protein
MRKKAQVKVLSWQEQQDAIEMAFRELAIAPVSPDTLSYEGLIPEIPRQLVLLRGNPPPEKLPPKASLKRLTEATSALSRLLQCMSPLALEAVATKLDEINFPDPSLAALKKQLLWLEYAAKCAELPNSRRAPTKTQSRKIAEAVAEHYEALTGKKPTVSFDQKNSKDYSPFVTLLQRVYDALNVNASAASQARALIRRKKED